MDLFEELKYFVLTNEKSKNRSMKWKCNIDECGKIMGIGSRFKHLKHNHLNIFQQIDKKLPIKDATKKRTSGSRFKCIMCGEEFKHEVDFSEHRRLNNLNIFVIILLF